MWEDLGPLGGTARDGLPKNCGGDGPWLRPSNISQRYTLYHKK